MNPSSVLTLGPSHNLAFAAECRDYSSCDQAKAMVCVGSISVKSSRGIPCRSVSSPQGGDNAHVIVCVGSYWDLSRVRIPETGHGWVLT